MSRAIACLLVLGALTACGDVARQGEQIATEVQAEQVLAAARSKAMERYDAGDWATFVTLMEPVAEQGNRDVDWYNLACGYALAGQKEKALDTLELVAQRGQAYRMAEDEDLDSLRGDPRFQEILATATVHEEADARLGPYREMAMDAYRAGDYERFTRIMEPIARSSAAEGDEYNLACGYALTGRADKAFVTLSDLFDRGADFGAANDDDFASLHDDPRWAALMARAP